MGCRKLVLFLCLLCLAVPGGARAGVITDDLRTFLKSGSPDEYVTVILRFAPPAEPLLSGKVTERFGRSRLVRAMKVRTAGNRVSFEAAAGAMKLEGIRPLWIINGVVLAARRSDVEKLARLPMVEKLSLDHAVPLSDMSVVPADAPTEWNIDAVHVRELWNLGHRGQGMVVASMDTGVDPEHPDLKGKWRGGSNSWFDPYGEHDSPHDAQGHGTQTMGVMVGGDAGGAFIGTAPRARWIAVKMFNDDDTASESAIHEGFQWLLDPDGDPDTDDAPDVVNNSWGFDENHGECIEGYEHDIEVLRVAGIAVVFAAGSGGPLPGSGISPANYPGVFSVGAVDRNLVVSPSSGRGPSPCDGDLYPDMVAPSEGVRTADLSLGGNLFYVNVAGTSFAVAHVAGIMALLQGAFPGLSVDELEQSLYDSARDLGMSGPDDVYGHGLVDAVAAYDLLMLNGRNPCIRPEIDFSAEPRPAMIGSPIEFSCTVSGGTPPYIYRWDVNGDGISDYDLPSFIHTYEEFYDGIVEVVVTDSVGCSSKLTIADRWVTCDEIVLTVEIDPEEAHVGETVTFSAGVSGGVPPYTYRWDLDGDGDPDCATASCTHRYESAFSGYVELQVTDSRGCPSELYRHAYTVSGGEVDSSGGGACFVDTIDGVGKGLPAVPGIR